MLRSCYVCCRPALVSLYQLVLRGVGVRTRLVCEDCADDLRQAPRLFWMMAGLGLALPR